MKTKVPYSHFEFISYILQGAVLLTALDVRYGVVNAVLNYAKDHPFSIPSLEGAVVFLSRATCYLLGQANSALAHKVLQDAVTKFTLGRPSHYLLRGSPDARLRYFRRLEQVHLDKVLARAKADAPARNRTGRDVDGEVFALAFHHANASEGFSDRYQNLLSAFNFSRNMACALFLSIPIVYPEIKDHRAFVASVVAIAVLITVRYLYLLRTTTKEILVHYADGYEAAPTPQIVDWPDFVQSPASATL